MIIMIITILLMIITRLLLMIIMMGGGRGARASFAICHLLRGRLADLRDLLHPVPPQHLQIVIIIIIIIMVTQHIPTSHIPFICW